MALGGWFRLNLNFFSIWFEFLLNEPYFLNTVRDQIFFSVVAILKPLESTFGKLCFTKKLDLWKIYTFYVLWTLWKVEWSPICRIFSFVLMCLCFWFLFSSWYRSDKMLINTSKTFQRFFPKTTWGQIHNLFPYTLYFTLLY